ncbi:cullin-1-like isoform X2 [Mangifera indica]|uniref:cullin-1-like isoform X2 n=1 Tax=Mangifera indica TaxID=29780 RepID=UPI001CFC4092|nr:cullin-1-like isoform X2 [Mangifera indica]
MLKFISLEEGMLVVEEAIVKAKKKMEGYEMKFTGEEYQRFYECVYFMCTSRGSDEKAARIYERYKSCLEESIHMVLPSLTSKTDVNLLREVVRVWSNYKAMARWLCRFFEYLDRYFIPQKKELPKLDKLSVKVFQELVFKNLYSEIQAAVLSLIKQEREGLQIDQDLLKNVIFIISEIDNCGEIKYYLNFEHVMLYESSSYYAQLSSEWLLSDSYSDYVKKALWCLSQEEKRASQYLYPNTGVTLLQVVKFRLLIEPGHKLAEKKQAEKSGFVTEFQLHFSTFSPVILFLLEFSSTELVLVDHLQAVLSKCANLNLEGESSASTPEEWMSAVMGKETNIL